ncbi:MAG: aldehyde ferredoxin oxidoreductase family protein [Anaerolineae bacterium]
MKGCTGKILVVDLTKRTCEVQELPEEVYRKYLGGYGLGAYYIYKHIKPGCDPLGPDNILGFTPGLLTGSGAPFSGRYMVCGKSPLTGKGKRANGEYSSGGWGNANAGGTFGPAIKRAGFDAIFLTGESDKPVYLLVTPDKISIEDAEFLWGKDAVETENELVKLHGSRASVATIGTAGENLSLISGIVNDKGRIAARSGLGAVMGSKKLKAVCLLGKTRVEFADRPTMQALIKAYFAQVKAFSENKMMLQLLPEIDYVVPLMRLMGAPMGGGGDMISTMMGTGMGGAGLGTSLMTVLSSQNGDSPVKNYKGIGYLDFPMRKAMNLRGKTIKKKYGKRQYGCFSCPLRCGYILEYDKLPYEDKETHRPEYETLAAFGSLILNSDLDTLLQVNEYLNRAGMDSISVGTVVAYVLEAVEEGVLKKEDFVCADYPDGFLPVWEDPTYIMPLLKLLVTREGIGDKLADGVFVAKSYYPETETYAIQAGGSELGMHDIRLGTGDIGMSMVADPTPGRHTTPNYGLLDMGMADFFTDLAPKIEKAEHPYQRGKSSHIPVKIHQAFESLGLCLFAYYLGKYPLLELIESATGWKMDVDEILEIGYRIQTTRQMFNAREGAIRHEIAQRAIGSPPQSKGPLKGQAVDVEVMIQGYYEGMGFGQDGVPLPETLNALGLDAMIPDLEISTGAPQRLINEYLVSDMAMKDKKKVPTPMQGG